jgi:hypothetical protein
LLLPFFRLKKLKCSVDHVEFKDIFYKMTKRKGPRIAPSVPAPSVPAPLVIGKGKGPRLPPRTTDVKPAPHVEAEMALQTEDTGKIFEMAICLAYGIPYDGPFKYSVQEADRLQARLTKLTELFPMCRHTAKKGAQYDFTGLMDETKHLSAKSTKKGVGKVAPQVVGQSQPTAFCEKMGVEFTTIPALKEYIQTNIVSILPILVRYTFDCPTVYYNREKNTIRYIELRTPIDWSTCQFKWTCNWTTWNNSSTLKVIIGEKEIALLEFQIHTKSRTNMAIRWCYENFLTIFKEHLSIVDI